MCNFDLRMRSRAILLIGGWLIAALVMPSSVFAGCLQTPNSGYSVLIDASSSCDALSSNMSGCTTDSSGLCTIDNPIPGGDPIVIQVTPSNAVGSVPVAPGLVSWQVVSSPVALTGKEVDFGILIGATGGGTCGWSYTPGANSDAGMAFLKSNGSYQKVNDIFFCSDFAAPPPSIPKLLVEKTVMLAGGTCGTDDVENLSAKVGDDVQYCFFVENVGIGDASDVTLSDPDVFATDHVIGLLAAGGSTLVTSSAVTIADQGETVNTATVTGLSADLPSFPVDSDSDTATVNATLALELCPDDYQGAVDSFFIGEDGFKYAALLDPTNPDRLSICIPSNATSTVECVDQCIMKDVCKIDPLDPECTSPKSKCVESGNWTNGDPLDCQVTTAPGQLPYCWEAIQDRDQNCEYQAVDPLQATNIEIMLYHDNPFCYMSCADIAELKSCNYICF